MRQLIWSHSMTSLHLWRLEFIMKRILRMIGPPVESERRNSNHLFITGRKHRWAATRQTHMRSSTKRMFLLSPSMAFISASEREKSNICRSATEHCKMHSLFYTQQFAAWTVPHKQTWKFSLMRTGLKLFGMTATPLCRLNLKATWAVVLLYFLATDTRSSSSNNGGHLRFTLWKWFRRTQPMTGYTVFPSVPF